jgi:hypothetical protein
MIGRNIPLYELEQTLERRRLREMEIRAGMILTNVSADMSFEVLRSVGDLVITRDPYTGGERIFTFTQAGLMKLTYKVKNICPGCGEPMDRILYSDYGSKVFKNGRWQEDDFGSSIEFEHRECGHRFEYEELEAMEVL